MVDQFASDIVEIACTKMFILSPCKFSDTCPYVGNIRRNLNTNVAFLFMDRGAVLYTGKLYAPKITTAPALKIKWNAIMHDDMQVQSTIGKRDTQCHVLTFLTIYHEPSECTLFLVCRFCKRISRKRLADKVL